MPESAKKRKKIGETGMNEANHSHFRIFAAFQYRNTHMVPRGGGGGRWSAESSWRRVGREPRGEGAGRFDQASATM